MCWHEMFDRDGRGVHYFPIGKTLRLYPWSWPPKPLQGWDLVRVGAGPDEFMREDIYFDKPRDALELAVIRAVIMLLKSRGYAETRV